jgi:putative transport protein
MRELLQSNPLLLFAVVAAIGALLGSVRIGGVSVGVAAVLFAGLGVSGLLPGAQLPEVLQQLGLVLFVYTIGLASAPGVRGALRGRRKGMLLAVAAVLAASALLTAGGAGLAGLTAPRAAGLFAGALTNTPALAEVVQLLRDQGAADTAAPVVAYSVAYPAGVLGSLAGVLFALRGQRGARAASVIEVSVGDVRITRDASVGKRLGDVRATLPPGVTFGRHRRGSTVRLAGDDVVLEKGDCLSVVGAPDVVEGVIAELGERAADHVEDDRSILDFRRILVSQRKVVGIPLAELNLAALHGGRITRVRRGDRDFVPSDETRLEPGDRVRVVAPRERMAELARFFGDSAKAVSEVDMLPFGLGIALGVLVGHLTVPLPGGLSFRLGMAGGPLVVGMVLGSWARTGPLVWTLPGSANLTLRQFGLVLFFAAVGTRSGPAFFRVVATHEGLVLAGIGAVITMVTAAATVLVGRRLLRMSPGSVAGLVAAVHTQPAALAFAEEQGGGEDASLTYAAAFPVATVAKILAAECVVRFLAG